MTSTGQRSGARLSSSDSAMFIEEDLHPDLRAGVGMVWVFDGAAPSQDEFAAHFQARIAHIPRLRQKVAYGPGRLLRPRWVEDPLFHLSSHLEAHDLPPGDFDELLRDLAGSVYGERLSRRGPAWEAHLVRQDRGSRFAVIMKIHHALADGVTLGQYLTPALFGDPGKASGGVSVRPATSRARAWRDGVIGLKNALLELLKPTAPIRGLTGAQRPGRVLRWRSLERQQFQVARERHGGTINDVYLTVTSNALREVVEDHHSRDVFALVPVSTRTPQQAGEMGNRMSVMRVSLPMHHAALSQIHDEVARRAARAKQSRQAEGASLVLRLEAMVPQRLLRWCVDSHTSTRLFHVVVSNIRGAVGDFQLGDGRLVHPWIVNYLPHDHRFVITLLSFEGSMGVVVMGDSTAAEQCERLIERMAASLSTLAGEAEAPPMPSSSANAYKPAQVERA